LGRVSGALRSGAYARARSSRWVSVKENPATVLIDSMPTVTPPYVVVPRERYWYAMAGVGGTKASRGRSLAA
jgi:hypothetical protein